MSSLAELMGGPERHTLLVCGDTGQWWELIHGHRRLVGGEAAARKLMDSWSAPRPLPAALYESAPYTVARMDCATLEALPLHTGPHP